LVSAAQAAVRTDYDPILKKWVTYDTKAFGFYHGGMSLVAREFDYRLAVRQGLGKHQIIAGPGTVPSGGFGDNIYKNGNAIKYGIGVGREGFQWSGTDTISRKAEWPEWTPPQAMVARERAHGRILPNHMAGGLDNPLGARALYIGAREYRIHGSNEPWTIGHAVSSGCIRLTNEDVIDLYDRVSVGTRVVVLLSTQPQSKDLVASNRSEYKLGSPAPKPPLSVEAPAARVLTKPLVVEAPPKPAIAPNPPVADATKAAIELSPEERPEQPASGVKAFTGMASSGAPVAAAEVRATVELKRPVSVREVAVMAGVPAVAGEVKAVIEAKSPPIAPKAALRKDEPVDPAPVATIPAKAAAGEVINDDSRR
jgi:lipoprotein-anchoring transpeptidase ErfK/SrfK